jgi:hypothetical protein
VLSRDDAVFPTKAHESDAGFDLTIVELIGTLGSDVYLYDTGIKVAFICFYYLVISAIQVEMWGRRP